MYKGMLHSHVYHANAQDMQGGHLTIFEVISGDNLVPSRHIQAEQNLLVRFRGSAPHRFAVLLMRTFKALPSPAQQGKAWCACVRHRVHRCEQCACAAARLCTAKA